MSQNITQDAAMSHEMKLVDGVWHVGIEAASEMCGVTSVTFRKWLEQPNPPPFSPRITMAPLGALGDWIGRERLFKTGRGGGYPYLPDVKRIPGFNPPPVTIPGLDEQSGQPARLDKLTEEARLTKLRADKIALEIAEQEGRLVDANAVSDAWAKVVTIAKTRLLRIPAAAAPLIAGEPDPFVIQKRLDETVRDALEHLSKGDQGDEEDVE